MFKKLFSKSKQSVKFSPQFTDEQLKNWPSIPDQDKKVPNLDEIITAGLDSSLAAIKLRKYCQRNMQKGDKVEYQAVMESQYGLFVIPGIIQQGNSNKFTVYYSITGEWDDLAFEKLLQWTVFLRSCDFVHTFKVVLCDGNPPRKTREIVSAQKEHRMLVSMIPNIIKEDHVHNARVFSECFAFFCNDKRLLNFDLISLQLVEEWYTKEVKSTARDSWHFSLFVRMVGSWYGELICEISGGKWKIKGEEWSPIELEQNGQKVMLDFFKLVSDYICSPSQQTSLTANFQLFLESASDF